MVGLEGWIERKACSKVAVHLLVTFFVMCVAKGLGIIQTTKVNSGAKGGTVPDNQDKQWGKGGTMPDNQGKQWGRGGQCQTTKVSSGARGGQCQTIKVSSGAGGDSARQPR